jgi:hypothetical protein
MFAGRMASWYVPKRIKVEGKVYSVPDDATDEEINQIVGPAAQPPQEGMMAHIGRNFKEGLGLPDHPIHQLGAELGDLIQHPWERTKATLEAPFRGMANSTNTELQRAGESWRGGHYGNAVAHGFYSAIPGGSTLADAGQQFSDKDFSGGLAKTAGFAAPLVLGSPEGRAGVAAAANPIRNAAATGLERSAGPVSTAASVLGAGHELLEGRPYQAAVVAGLGKPAVGRTMNMAADILRPAEPGIQQIHPNMVQGPAADTFAAGVPKDVPMTAGELAEGANWRTPVDTSWRPPLPHELTESEQGEGSNWRAPEEAPRMVGTSAGAASDTANFQQAQQQLGPGAKITDVLDLAQKMKPGPASFFPPESTPTPKRPSLEFQVTPDNPLMKPYAPVKGFKPLADFTPPDPESLSAANRHIQELRDYRAQQNPVYDMNAQTGDMAQNYEASQRRSVIPAASAAPPPEIDLTDILQQSIDQANARKAASTPAEPPPRVSTQETPNIIRRRKKGQ